jgi:hypothetical protein
MKAGDLRPREGLRRLRAGAAAARGRGGLRRRIEALLLPDDLRIVLELDRSAQRERDRRRAQAQLPTR